MKAHRPGKYCLACSRVHKEGEDRSSLAFRPSILKIDEFAITAPRVVREGEKRRVRDYYSHREFYSNLGDT